MEEIDVEGATERVHNILHPDVREVAPGKTVVLQRKRRSDAGVPKPKPEIPEGHLKMTIILPVDEATELLVHFAKLRPEIGHMILDAFQDAMKRAQK